MSTTGDADLTVLSWIKTEIAQSLNAAAEGLRGTADAKVIEQCVQEIHRLGGALQMAGVVGLSHLCDAIEGVLRSLAVCPDATQGRALITSAIDALGNYIDDLLAGAPNRPMRLFPLYRSLRIAQGHDKVSAADLFYPSVNIALPPVSHATSGPIDQAAKSARKIYQRGMLSWLRGEQGGVELMLEAVVLMDTAHRVCTGFWWVASAFLESIGQGGIAQDSQVKKLCARVDAQLGRVEKASPSIAEGLFRELLYFVACSKSPTDMGEQVIRAYRLREHLVGAGEAQAAPMVDEDAARKDVHRVLRDAKEAWSLYCEEGDDHLDAFSQQLKLLLSGTQSVAFTGIHTIAEGIGEALSSSAFESKDERAIAVAGALLVSEEILLAPASAKSQALSKINPVLMSLSAQGSNQSSGQTDAEETLEPTLISEIVKSLKQVEHHVGSFFKDEGKKRELSDAIGHLQQALNIFQMASAQRAVVVVHHCLDMLRAWAQRDAPSQRHEQESFAQSLTALDFYLMAKSRGERQAEVYVAPILTELGWTEPKAAQAPAPSNAPEAASVEAELQEDLRETLALVDKWMQSNASTLTQLEDQLKSIYADAVLVADKHTELSSSRALAMIRQTVLDPLADISQAIGAIDQQSLTPVTEDPTDIPCDNEIAEVFLEEATEVLESIAANRHLCEGAAGDSEAVAAIRRGFHTLKGSSRMAGLTHMGEVAWSMERLLNQRIDQELSLDAPTLSLIDQAHAAFSRWVAALLERGSAIIDGQGLSQQSQRLLNGQPIESAPMVAPTPKSIPATQIELGHGNSVSTTLFKIFQTESHQHVETLRGEHRDIADGKPVRHEFMRAAHTLAGISRTLQIPSLAELAYALESCLQRHLDLDTLPDAAQCDVYDKAIEVLASMVAMVCAREPVVAATPALMASLEVSLSAATSNTKVAVHAVPVTAESDDALYAAPGLEDLDPELRETFMQEALELTAALGSNLQAWSATPKDLTCGAAVARVLHTFKGSARAAGAMMLGEQVHRIEEQVQRGIDEGSLTVKALEALLGRFDHWYTAFERQLKADDNGHSAVAGESAPDAEVPTAATQMANMQLRVRADAVERLAEAAGELNIARARMSEQIRGARQMTFDLNDSMTRLRAQLREIEIQAESQMKARLTHLDEHDAEFDPLEFDRFTRLQELSRFMAESLHDIGTVQQNLLRHFQDVDAVLISHGRVNRELNRELNKIQTVAFASVQDRLQRLMRQTCAELGKPGSLVIQGGQVELDRRLLEQILSPLEHMIRNAVVHGIESVEGRRLAGKDENGKVTIALRQEANQVILMFSDDGAGLDVARIRAKAQARQLISVGDVLSDEEILELIFMAGFSTAEQVTEVAGRGVGMDVVRSVVTTLGGEVDVRSRPGAGTIFTLSMPLTMVVAQAVTVRAAARRFAIPAGLVLEVLRGSDAALGAMYSSRSVEYRGQAFAFHSLDQLLGEAKAGDIKPRNNIVLLIASGEQRMAIHVDEVFRNEELPVKEIGPQLSRAPGVTGASISGDGRTLLIINPLELVARQTDRRTASQRTQAADLPLVLVVDDSVTVRKVTSRLMARAGYRVHTAKDGVDALEQLQGERPVAVLLDIEMPRMDGFELTEHIRADQRLAKLPLIMISSRTAEKHRKRAQSLGVNEFLGKPYHEDELLSCVQRYQAHAAKDALVTQ